MDPRRDDWVLSRWERIYENPPCEDDLHFLDEPEGEEEMTEEEENEYIELLERIRRLAMIKGGYHNG